MFLCGEMFLPEGFWATQEVALEWLKQNHGRRLANMTAVVSSPECFDLLRRLLCWQWDARASAAQALEHIFFHSADALQSKVLPEGWQSVWSQEHAEFWYWHEQ